MTLAFLQNCSPLSIILILVIVVLLFGSKKIPDLARSLGKAKGEFKKGIAEGAAEAEDDEGDENRKVSKKKKVQQLEADDEDDGKE